MAGEVTVSRIGVSDACPLSNTSDNAIELTRGEASRLARIEDESPSPYDGGVGVECITQFTSHRYYPHLAAFAVADHEQSLFYINVFPAQIYHFTPSHAGLGEDANQ